MAGSIAFAVAGIVTYVTTLAWLPAAQAADNPNMTPVNIQTTQLLAYNGGSSILEDVSFPEMRVVSDHAIQPDLGIFDLNDSGFVVDAPEINQRTPELALQKKPFTHIVSPGDTLSGIAARYNLKLDTVLWANDLNRKSVLRAGKELVILPLDGVQHTVRSGDTLSGIAAKYEAKSSEIASYNNIDPSRLVIGKELIIPGGTGNTSAAVVQKRSVLSAPKASVQAGQIIGDIMIPVSARVSQGYGPTPFALTSGFYVGNMHGGIDLANKTGTPVYAAHDGTVILAGTLRGYGKVVYLKGKDLKGRTVFTRYGHLDSYSVKKNQVLKAGEQLGRLGSTGRSTGPHLHFEVRDASNKQWVNHELYQMYWGY